MRHGGKGGRGRVEGGGRSGVGVSGTRGKREEGEGSEGKEVRKMY